MYIDTHAHIISKFYNNIDEIIENAKKNNVCKIINCADDLDTCYEVIELSKKHSGVVYPAVGVHPSELQTYNRESLKEIESLIQNNKIIAIGEIGLDFYYGKNKLKQKRVFKTFLNLASKYNLPVLVHSRNAKKETLKILKKYNLKGIIHCFSDDLESAKEYIKMGYYIGVGGTSTFKKSDIKEVIKNIDINRIVLETDSPYLSPEPLRGKTNEPKNIPVIAKNLSGLTNKTEEEIQKITTQNAMDIFDF